MTARILVVDDEVGMQVALREVLKRLGHAVRIAPDALEALEALESETFDLVVTDVRMPEMSGIELLETIGTRWPGTAVLVITAYGTVEDAVEAMKKGAADYLLKPFSSETVEEAVARLLEARREAPLQADAPEAAQEHVSGETAVRGGDPVAVSEASRQVLELAGEIADSSATVLIQGASGTGKEVVARYVHNRSNRRDKPFVAVNCAALPEGLLESELFGHEKGAFTGAVLSRKGKFEMANHGTLLLDEVSEMPLSLQAKLLRVLQEREIDPIGSQRTVPLDVRVVATTNRDLAAHVREGHFREDLYYRLHVVCIEIPPLRERPEDILPMSEHFVRRHCRVNRRPRRRIGEAMREFLLAQPWHGNVRELENFLERAVLLCRDEELHPDRLFLGSRPPSLAVAPEAGENGGASAASPALSARGAADRSAGIMMPGEIVTLEEMERRLILRTLEKVGGNRTRAADLLGVSVRTIRNKLNLYGMGKDGGAEVREGSGSAV